jgi:hypothetical protein
MGETGDGSRFQKEALAALLARLPLADELDGHAALEVGVDRQPDHPHAALAQLALELVLVEPTREAESLGRCRIGLHRRVGRDCRLS